ncbi:hypothetical protein [Streptomyces sp. SID3343]|uniref:hypothetical protein n=1 Tax=Streptomyces sp. SID3343 TaxID=2690260 RepID=UPI00136E4D25|nr:hypothetical protein [Streptomyces sp. SID3343]MYW03518.1 hypothetical protein [Streptomyces sp. SID3343]
MTDALWSRLSQDARAEVDRLITEGRNIQAIVSMRESAGPPTPGIHACVDLLQWRFEELGLPSA